MNALRNRQPHAGPSRKSSRFPIIAAGCGKLLEIEDRLFTERRIRLYGASIAVTYAALLAWEVFRGRSVLDPAGRPACIDFCSFWISGNFATSSDPSRVYDYSLFSAAQLTLVGPLHSNFPPYHYWYPPTFLFFTYALGLMPYLTAFAVWNIVTLLLYMAAVYAIIPRWAALLAALTPIAVAENLLLGQSALLTAAFIGLSLAFMERRPWASGIFIGLLTYRPHFGIVFPFVLLASRNWRTFATATAASVTLGAAAAIVFGYQGWPSFVATLLALNSSLNLDPGLELTLQSVYGLLHWAGAGAGIAWTLHLVAAAAVMLTVCVVWAQPNPHALKAATLCIGALAVTPYVQLYDLCVLSIAVAFLVSDGLSRGFLAGERAALLVCFTALFFLLLPFGSIIYALILFLIARRIMSYRRWSTAGPQSRS